MKYNIMKKIYNAKAHELERDYKLKRYGKGQDFYLYKDNGSNILAVAHLDSVQQSSHFVSAKLSHKEIIFSPVHDDRLGVYTILDFLPRLGIKMDILLTNGEETGRSTAKIFETDKKYNWIVEFDRTGTDVACYHYLDTEFSGVLSQAGFRGMTNGIYTDICDLKLGVKGFNVGVGYYDYHSKDAYMVVEEYKLQMEKFVKFYNLYSGTLISHKEKTYNWAEEDWYTPKKDKKWWKKYAKSMRNDMIDKYECFICGSTVWEDLASPDSIKLGVCDHCLGVDF